MTIGELMVFNSTIASGDGTVLDHLTNVAVEREVFCGIDGNVGDAVNIDISSGIIAANIREESIIINFIETSTINTNEVEIGVNV